MIAGRRARNWHEIPWHARSDEHRRVARWLPPDYLTESEPTILVDSQRLVETHHDSSRFAMTRVALPPVRHSRSAWI